MSGIFLRNLPILWDRVLQSKPEVATRASLGSQLALEHPLAQPLPSETRIKGTYVPSIYVGLGDPSLGGLACIKSILKAKPSPQPKIILQSKQTKPSQTFVCMFTLLDSLCLIYTEWATGTCCIINRFKRNQSTSIPTTGVVHLNVHKMCLRRTGQITFFFDTPKAMLHNNTYEYFTVFISIRKELLRRTKHQSVMF